VAQTSASVKVWQRLQWCMRVAACSACDSQALRAVAVVLQQVEGHALRRLHAHAGQAAQRVDQAFDAADPAPATSVGRRHQNGNFMPGGSGMPAVSLPIFSC
jgi:hypothetical protein